MTIMAAADRRLSVTSMLRAVELGSIGLGVLLIGVLHVVPPTSAIDPLTVTISQYGRSVLAGVFVSGVVLIALGSTATLILLVQSGVCRAWSAPGLGLALWVVGMIGVALFQKADWAAGATFDGYVHRAASVIAFVALPAAILMLALREARRRGRPPTASRSDRRLLAAASVLTLLVLAAIFVLGMFIAVAEAEGAAWWTMLPIGLTERLLVSAELSALALLVSGVRILPSGPQDPSSADAVLGSAEG
jgi:hypothetical protein